MRGIGIPITGPMCPGFFEDRETAYLPDESKSGLLSQPVGESCFVFSTKILMGLPVTIEFVTLALV